MQHIRSDRLEAFVQVGVAVCVVLIAGQSACANGPVAERDEAASRWRLQAARLTEWESDHQHAKALADARRLLADPQATSEQYDFLLDRVAFNLFNLNRIDEGIECYDRQIRSAVDHPHERLRLLESKAELLLSHVEPARGIPACREFRHATEPLSAAWKTATAMLALELSRNAQHEEALALRQELLISLGDAEAVKVCALLIEIARSQKALGHINQAHESLDRAQKAAHVKAPARPQEQLVMKLRAEIIELRESLLTDR